MSLEYLYRCPPTSGSLNNGLLPLCEFEMIMTQGPHNCPLCGTELAIVPSSPSVSEVLRRGQLEVDKNKSPDQNKGTQ